MRVAMYEQAFLQHRMLLAVDRSAMLMPGGLYSRLIVCGQKHNTKKTERIYLHALGTAPIQ